MVVGVGSKNISGSFLEIIEQQGWTGLWAGNAINMLRIIPTQAIELGTFECVKRAMTSAQEKWKQGDGPKLQIGKFSLDLPLSWISPVAVAGAAAGVSGTIVCHPLEVLKVLLVYGPPTKDTNLWSRVYSYFFLVESLIHPFSVISRLHSADHILCHVL